MSWCDEDPDLAVCEDCRRERNSRLDLFAAAALTGLVAKRGCKYEGESVEDAWKFARAMLDNEPKEKS